MGFWKYLSICLLVVIIVSIISNGFAGHMCSRHIRNCIVTNGISNAALNAPVKRLYLATAKLFPILNSVSTMHWSVIAETDIGFINISTSRFMTMYLYPVTRDGTYYFIPFRWEPRLYMLKRYDINDKLDGPITAYTIARTALSFYNMDNKLSYSIINNNCQHVSQFIIKTFGKTEEDDEFVMKHSGYELFKRSLKDALNGPKAMI